MKTLVLASQSPRRKQLLQKAGFKFQTLSVEISEKLNKNLNLDDALMDLARQKAVALIDSGKLLNLKDFLILSADTEVVLEQRVFGKPKNSYEAFEMLRLLSGKIHAVKTAICIWNSTSGEFVTDISTTLVEFNELSDDEINAYINACKPFDKAGGYGLQELPTHFVKQVNGFLDTVVGLPVKLVEELLEKKKWYVDRI